MYKMKPQTANVHKLNNQPKERARVSNKRNVNAFYKNIALVWHSWQQIPRTHILMRHHKWA